LTLLIDDACIDLVRLIKIDVEGSELEVVQGLASLLPRFREDAEIVVEVTPKLLGESGVAKLFAIFEDHGFKPYEIRNSYNAKDYYVRRSAIRPLRLERIPTTTSDIVFSRIDCPEL